MTHPTSPQPVYGPMRKAPERGTDYWRLMPTGGWLYCWTGDSEDWGYLRNGLAFATREALASHQHGAAQAPAVKAERNDPVSALAIRLLVAAGACSQADANTAFHAACSMLEDEAERQGKTLPWVGRKLSPLTDEQVRKGFRVADEHDPVRHLTAWQVWSKAVDWTQHQFAITASQPPVQDGSR